MNMVERQKCTGETPVKPKVDVESEPVPEPVPKHNYVQFILNVHDIVFTDKSAQVLNDTITLHETYNVSVEIYLTGPMLHHYIAEEPWIISRMQDSEVVHIAYHFRPPFPVYDGFDTYNLADLSYDEKAAEIEKYHMYKLDLETGLYIENVSGGYTLVKEYFGAPWTVGHTSGGSDFSQILADLYLRDGTTFTVAHGRDYDLGEMNKGLYFRPEHAEIKWYEELLGYAKGDATAESTILEFLEPYTGGGHFVNIKMHENNYYTVGTPFGPIYWVDGNKVDVLPPPYDLSLGETTDLRRDGYYDQMFEWYEEALLYVTGNPELYEVVSPKDVVGMLPE